MTAWGSKGMAMLPFVLSFKPISPRYVSDKPVREFRTRPAVSESKATHTTAFYCLSVTPSFVNIDLNQVAQQYHETPAG
jgi:hypothetical protein